MVPQSSFIGLFQAAAAERKARGRSGWPQSIWAQDLKSEAVPTPGFPEHNNFQSAEYQAPPTISSESSQDGVVSPSTSLGLPSGEELLV